MRITNFLFIIISTVITILLFPSGNFIERTPSMINYFFIGYFIWMCASGILYYFINFFIVKNGIYFAFGVYLSIVAIICILLGVIKDGIVIDAVSFSLWFINLIVFVVLGSLGFWMTRLLTILFCK